MGEGESRGDGKCETMAMTGRGILILVQDFIWGEYYYFGVLTNQSQIVISLSILALKKYITFIINVGHVWSYKIISECDLM